MSLTPAIVILSPPGADEESLFEAESQSAVLPTARELRFVDSGGVRRTLGTGGSAFSCFCGCPILRAVREGWVRILVFVFNLAPACPERVEGLALSLEGASARHPFRCHSERSEESLRHLCLAMSSRGRLRRPRDLQLPSLSFRAKRSVVRNPS